jgi:hypothetical protein
MVALIVVGVVHALTGPGDEERIERRIEAVATGTDPYFCQDAVTVAYMEQITGSHRPFADDACEAASPHPADSVKVSDISVDGDVATAAVTYTGGSLDGSTTRVRLIKEGGVWKIDRRLGFAHFDRAGFRRGYRVVVGQFGSPAPAVRCALAHEARLTNAQVERSMLAGADPALTRISVACDREGVERSILGSAAAAELEPAASACFERRLAAVGAAKLAHLETDTPAFGRLLTSCDREAVVSYTRRKLIAEGRESRTEIACIIRVLRALPPAGQYRLAYDEERFADVYDRCEA